MRATSDLDTELMFDQACAFIDLAKATETEPSPIRHRTKSHGYVDLSLSALACEILIKCMIVQKGGSYNKEHELNHLWGIYNTLDSSNAHMIEDYLKNRFNSNDPEMFDKMIASASKSFEQWRYIFDYEASDGVGVNPQFLREFRCALQDICCKQLYGKTWNAFIEELEK